MGKDCSPSCSSVSLWMSVLSDVSTERERGLWTAPEEMSIDKSRVRQPLQQGRGNRPHTLRMSEIWFNALMIFTVLTALCALSTTFTPLGWPATCATHPRLWTECLRQHAGLETYHAAHKT